MLIPVHLFGQNEPNTKIDLPKNNIYGELHVGLFFQGVMNYEKQKIPATIYVHSWELTPEFMPKIKLPFKENFVTFHNIKNTTK